MLRRRALGRLSLFDPKPPVVRYERAAPGELIRLDIKTLGKIDGVGHRITGQHKGHRSRLFAATLRHAGVRHVRNPALHAAHHW